MDKILREDDHSAVFRAVYRAKGRWRYIGIALGMQRFELNSIKTRCDDNPEDCLDEMISCWLKRQDLNPTWQDLVDALKDEIVGEQGIAVDIERHYMKKERSQSQPEFPELSEQVNKQQWGLQNKPFMASTQFNRLHICSQTGY